MCQREYINNSHKNNCPSLNLVMLPTKLVTYALTSVFVLQVYFVLDNDVLCIEVLFG